MTQPRPGGQGDEPFEDQPQGEDDASAEAGQGDGASPRESDGSADGQADGASQEDEGSQPSRGKPATTPAYMPYDLVEGGPVKVWRQPEERASEGEDEAEAGDGGIEDREQSEEGYDLDDEAREDAADSPVKAHDRDATVDEEPTIDEDAPDEAPGGPVLPWLLAVVLLLAAMMGLRALAPSDIYDNDQPDVMAHIVDVAMNDQWLMQHDAGGRRATKPPMYPWVAGLTVRGLGLTSELVFKLPMIVAALLIALLVFDLARQAAGSAAGGVAACAWLANYHVFKLAYTARTDMLVTFFVILAVWAVQMQRPLWAKTKASRTRSEWGRLVAMVIVFGAATGAAFLTKGPPGALPLLWLVGMVLWDRRLFYCRPGLQMLGIAMAVLIPLAWLLPAIAAYPEWMGNINREVSQRLTGQSTSIDFTNPLAVPAYFMARFAPWSVLFVIAAIARRRLRAASQGHVLWTIGWVLLVLGFFMVPAGKRADYILPSYAGAAVLVGVLVATAQRFAGWHRTVTHLVLGGLALAGIGLAIAMPWLDRPNAMAWETLNVEPVLRHDPLWGLAAAVVLTASAGAVGLMMTHGRRYAAAAVAVAFMLAGVLGIYATVWSSAAKDREGDFVLAATHTADQLANQAGTPLRIYGADALPVRALLGNNPPPADAAEIEAIDQPTLLLLGQSPEDRELEAMLDQPYEVLLRTPRLPEAQAELVLIRTISE